jgi:hypothetical protein
MLPPQPTVRVAALAMPHRRANAVGAVWIVCGEDALEISCTHVRPYKGDFVMLGAARSAHLRVPYSAVRGLLRDGPRLYLSLDPQCAAVYNRFALARFATTRWGALQSRRQFRWLAALRLFCWLLPLLFGMAVLWLAVTRWGMSHVASWLTALACFGVMRRVATAWMARSAHGSAASERLAMRLEHAIEQRLGLSAGSQLAHDAGLYEAAPGLAPEPRLADVLRVNARVRRLALVGALASLGVVAIVGLLSRFAVADRIVLPVGHLARGLPPQTAQLVARAAAYGRPEHPACRCARLDVPALRAGVPRLSLLVVPRRARFATLGLGANQTHVARFDEPTGTRPHMMLELAAVNNGGQTIDSVSLVVTFARRDAQGRRRVVLERGLHWSGRLEPGSAVKWQLTGRGTEIKIHSRIDDRLGVEQLAPAQAFVALSLANTPAVRVHAAAVLSHLGDDRARAAVASLAQLGGATAVLEARDALQTAHAPLRACDLRNDDGQVRLCIYNGTVDLHRRLRVMGGLDVVVEDVFIPQAGLLFGFPGSELGPEAVQVVAVP